MENLQEQFHNYVEKNFQENVKELFPTDNFYLIDFNEINNRFCLILFEFKNNFLNLKVGSYHSGNTCRNIRIPFPLHDNFPSLFDAFIREIKQYLEIISIWNWNLENIIMMLDIPESKICPERPCFL